MSNFQKEPSWWSNDGDNREATILPEVR